MFLSNLGDFFLAAGTVVLGILGAVAIVWVLVFLYGVLIRTFSLCYIHHKDWACFRTFMQHKLLIGNIIEAIDSADKDNDVSALAVKLSTAFINSKRSGQVKK